MTDVNKAFWETANEFLSTLPPELGASLKSTGTSNTYKTTTLFTDRRSQKAVTLGDLTSWEKSQTKGLLIVKNISLAWIVALSQVFDIETSFFTDHALSPSAATPWDAVFPTGEFELRRARTSNENERIGAGGGTWHVDGVIEYSTQDGQPVAVQNIPQENIFPRVLQYSTAYGWNASVRFSFCVAAPQLYILLVDSPPAYLQDQLQAEYNKLKLPLSGNRGGVTLPALYGSNGAAMLDTFDAFGSHAWHIRALLGLSAVHLSVTPTIFFYLVITSTWQTNLRRLNLDLKHVAFHDIRRPNIQINDRLHDYREYLTYLRSQVNTTKQWIPSWVNEDLHKLKQALPSSEYVGEPEVRFEEILSEAKDIDRFLMDSFQLLMSSMSVLEAQRSLSQASRAQKVTTLAFVYVPLSFVTGIFGMNVAEINGSPLSVWVPAAVLVVTALCTLVVFGWSWVVERFRGWRGR